MKYKKQKLIWFDLYWDNTLVGTFSLNESEIEEINVLNITQYINDHIGDFFHNAFYKKNLLSTYPYGNIRVMTPCIFISYGNSYHYIHIANIHRL